MPFQHVFLIQTGVANSLMGEVTADTLPQMVEHTRLKDFASKTV
jgi:hypothetical protein